MKLRTIFRKSLVIALAMLSLLIAVGLLTTGNALLKLDYGDINSRAGWQLPDRVIASLEITQGHRVADIGAGTGYFTFRLADAVGPAGKVYAVDVDENAVRELRQRAQQNGYPNVEVILGRADDPLLPDGEIDVVFLCNAYHHIDGRPAYFARLKADLKPGGRVALIDMKAVPLVRLLIPAGHWSEVEAMRDEMRGAGYRVQKELPYLPFQSFILFEDAAR